MKEVKPAYDFLTPPAAAIEDMTQPMGPLEEGDQALVDAVQNVPAGEHMARQDDGSVVRLKKDGTYKQDIVLADTTEADGSTTGVSTLISTVSSGSEGISASKSEYLAGERGGRTTDHVSGNQVETSTLTMEPDRNKAQAVKLEVARKINEARDRIDQTGDTRSDDTELSRTAASAEDVMRDAAKTSEARAAAARAVGHEATASIHDMFAQAERGEGERVSQEILDRGTKPPEATA